MTTTEREYWEQRLSSAYSFDGVGWFGLGEPFNRWMYAVRRRLFLRRISPLVQGRATDVLDVGSGTGFYVERWLELGVRSITGSDLTSTAVERLQARFPGQDFHRVDIGGDVAELGEGRFDVVSAVDVLYHITDDASYERAFGNLARLLKPGGLLIFTENFVRGPTPVGPHQASRSLVTIEALVRDSGLVPVWRRPVFVLMNAPVDSDSRLLRASWGLIARVLRRWPASGAVIGAGLAPLEFVLASLRREGPSTEMMVCCKPT